MDALLVSTTEANTSVNPYIDIAKESFQEHFGRMMTIQSFVSKTNFNIDPLFVDEQWAMMNTQRSDELNVLTSEMIKRLNFSTVSKLIKKLSVLFPYTSNEYSGDRKNVVITTKILNKPSGSFSSNGGKRYHKEIKMTKNAYKELIMESQTEAARQVRKYYICLEDLFTQYLLYQQAYQSVLSMNRFEVLTLENKELSNKLDKVLVQNETLLVQNETQSQTLKLQSQQLDIQSRKLDVVARILYNESDHKVLDVKTPRKKQELVVLQSRTNTNEFPYTCRRRIC